MWACGGFAAGVSVRFPAGHTLLHFPLIERRPVAIGPLSCSHENNELELGAESDRTTVRDILWNIALGRG